MSARPATVTCCKIIVLLSLLSKMINSSLVIDSSAQRSFYVTDYCPKMKYCPEGAHVMCMYYNAKSNMGPRCSNAQNISMTPVLANKLVDVSNAIRRRIAQGKEKGKNGAFLPRGYGIFRLKWDQELATFAQVLANQCVLRHDLCRATSRFPDPGQTAGLVRFSYPDWFPVSKSGNFSTPGMSPAKLLYATTQTLKSWYGQKGSVTSNMITYYPDWSENPNQQDGRLYLEMIYGSATHVGCGISAYTEYAFYDNNAALNYNSVQIICNYSARPRKGTAVYNTVPPGDTDLPFSRCGCPRGSEPDEDCLCHESANTDYVPTPLKEKYPKCPDGEVCDPTVVLLPIFTVEDAPQEKLFNHESFVNTSLNKPTDSDFHSIENVFQNKRSFNDAKKIVSKSQVKYKSKNGISKQSRSKQNMRPTSSHRGIRNRYFDKSAIGLNVRERQSPFAPREKTSLFSRSPKFKLPELRTRPIKNIVVKDVLPRNFTNSQQVVTEYLFKNNNIMKTTIKRKPVLDKQKELDEHEFIKSNDHENHLKNIFNILEQTKSLKSIEPISVRKQIRKTMSDEYKSTTETIPVKKNIDQESVLSQLLNSSFHDEILISTATEESDIKLLMLLDNLEEEMKHVELRDKDKQVFDAKIRKIYGKVIGNHENLLHVNTKLNYNDKIMNLKPLVESTNAEDMKKKLDEMDRRSEIDFKYSNDSSTIDHKKKFDDINENKYLKDERHKDTSLEKSRTRYRYYDRDKELSDRKTYGYENDRNRVGILEQSRYIDGESKYMNEPRYRHYNEMDRRNNYEDEHRSKYDKHIERGVDRRIRNRNYYLSNDANDDILSIERRKFFQDRLDNIERRQQIKNHRKRKEKPRHIRPLIQRKSDNQMEIYGRARYAHGY